MLPVEPIASECERSMLHAPPEKSAEIWRAIPGYEGAYEVSDQGRVRSLDRQSYYWVGSTLRMRYLSGRVLRPGRRPCGHLTVALGTGNSCHVHLLVLAAFVGPLPKGKECLHMNGDPADNRLANLRYGTRSDNLQDRFWHKGRTLTLEQVRYLRQRQAEGFYYGERYRLSLAWGISSGVIYHVTSGKQYSHVR